jgi:MFS family permease
MLSTNFLLLKSAPLSKAEKRSLFMIFSSTYLDMYDMALFVGYSIYLSAIVLPPLKLFQALLVFSIVLFTVQLSKIFGIILFNRLIERYQRNIIRAPQVIGVCYLFLALIPDYSQIGLWAFAVFWMLRLIQGAAFGFEIGFTINYSNMNFNRSNKRFMYYFILFSGEIGALVSILFNRLLVDHGMSVYMFDLFWRLQFFMGCLFILVNLKFRVKHRRTMDSYSKFSRTSFFYTLKHNWRYILLRSLIISLHVCLIVMVIFRVPNFLHLAMGFSYARINVILLTVTVMGFVGANFARILALVYSPVRLMKIFYILVAVFSLFWMIFDGNKHYYVLWVEIAGFVYGVFVRLTPMVLYRVVDFDVHNRLTGRYLGNILAYSVFGSFAVLCLDLSRVYTHNFHDYAPAFIILVVSLLGFMALRVYTKHFTQV